MRYPPTVAPATTIDALVSSVDIAPTVLEFARAKIGAHVQGKSFLPLLTSKRVQAARRPAVLIELFSDDRPMPWVLDSAYKAIRTDRHKLIHWIQHPEFDELYDLQADPHEERNVIKDQSNYGLLEKLRSDLGRLVQQSIFL